MKVYKKDDKLYTDTNLYVKNAWKQKDGFHLVHGWYIYKEPISLNKDYEIVLEDNNICRIIKQLCTTDLTK